MKKFIIFSYTSVYFMIYLISFQEHLAYKNTAIIKVQLLDSFWPCSWLGIYSSLVIPDTLVEYLILTL